MNQLRAGDTLVVWRLDRLGRTLKHLIATVAHLSEHGIGFKSLQEQIDTTTSGGKLIFHIFGALAEFEREVIIERTNAGLQAARARGRFSGRPSIQSRDPKKVTLARKLYADHMPVKGICAQLHIGRSTLYRYLQDEKSMVGAIQHGRRRLLPNKASEKKYAPRQGAKPPDPCSLTRRQLPRNGGHRLHRHLARLLIRSPPKVLQAVSKCLARCLAS
jgi:hypothetical protein